MLLQQWFGQSLLLPMILAFASAGIFRIIWGIKIGPMVAGSSIGIAFVFAYFVAIGFPAWPATGSVHKIFYLGIASFLIGTLLDSEGFGVKTKRLLILLFPLFAMGWVITPLLSETVQKWELMLVCISLVAVLIIFARLSRPMENEVIAPIQLALAASGVAAIAWYGGSFSQVKVGLILASSLVGFILWNWPVSRFRSGAALLLCGGIPTIALALQIAIYSNAGGISLVVLTLVFFTDWLADGIQVSNLRIARAFRPLLVVVTGLLVISSATLASVMLP